MGGVDSERVVALEQRVAQQQVLLESLNGKVSEIQKAYESLSEQHCNLAADQDVLASCLEAKTMLSQRELDVAKRTRRCSALVRDMLRGPRLAESIGHFAGIHASLALAETSQHNLDRIRPVLPALVAGVAPQVYICGGSSGGSASAGLVERLHLPSAAWEVLPDMPTSRVWCGAAALSGFLYVLGGRGDHHSGDRDLATNERFDPIGYRWECLPPMPTARAQCAVAAAQGKLQVFGGNQMMDKTLAAAESFDPSEQRWEQLPWMTRPRDACVATSSQGLVYLVGGRESQDRSSCLSIAECFDISVGQWVSLPPMPTPRAFCGAAICSGCLYVFGGYRPGKALAIVERFTISTGTWEAVEPMPTARSNCAAIAAQQQGYLHVFGGDERIEPHFETLDHGTGAWLPRVRMPTSRWACAVAALRL